MALGSDSPPSVTIATGLTILLMHAGITLIVVLIRVPEVTGTTTVAFVVVVAGVVKEVVVVAEAMANVPIMIKTVPIVLLMSAFPIVQSRTS